LRLALLVDRHAASAGSIMALSAAVSELHSRVSSSQSADVPVCCSICRASLSPIARDELI
jgi:hypothetical protein